MVRFGYLRFVSSTKLMVEQEGWKFNFFEKQTQGSSVNASKEKKKGKNKKLTVVSFISKVDR